MGLKPDGSAAVLRENFYAGDVPGEVAAVLEQAMAHYGEPDVAERFLLEALALAPAALSVHFSLYKFYFYQGRLQDAEAAVHRAMAQAAKQAGFVNDYTALTVATVDWHRHESPQHFYLFSLKALAFIRLRLGDKSHAEVILNLLRQLDPADTIGASVIAALAQEI